MNLDSHQFAAFWVAVYHISQAEQFAHLRCTPSFCLSIKCCCLAVSPAWFYCLFQNTRNPVIFLKVLGGVGFLVSYFLTCCQSWWLFSNLFLISYACMLHEKDKYSVRYFLTKTNCINIMPSEGSFFIVLIVYFFFNFFRQVKKPLIIHFLGIDCFRKKDGGNCYLWQLKDNITGSWGCQSHNQGCLVRGTKLLPLGKPKQIGSSWKKWVNPGGRGERK